MVTKTKTLQLVFLSGESKKINLLLPDAADNLDSGTVKSAMSTIAQADAFEKEGVDMYKVPQAASYIERITTSLFDNPADKSEQFAGTKDIKENN